MKRIHLILEERLVRRVDRAARTLGMTRSQFTHQALEVALAQLHVQELEAKHRVGYQRHPVCDDEFSPLLGEQVWPG